LGIGRVQVARWRQRYLESGIEGIEGDLPRGARTGLAALNVLGREARHPH